MCNRHESTRVPCGESLHLCPNCPSKISREPKATSRRSEASRSLLTTGSSFYQLPPRTNAKANSESSNDIYPPPSINRGRSNSQLLETSSSTTCIKNPREEANSCSSTNFRQERFRSCTAATPPRSGRSARFPYKRYHGIDQPLFERIDEHPSTTDLHNQRDESTSLEPPLTALVDDNFNGDWELGHLNGNLTQSNFSICTDDPAGPMAEQGAEQMLAQTLDGFSHGDLRESSQSHSGFISGYRDIREAFGDIGLCSHNVKSCMIVAIRILQTLHIPSPTCMSIQHNRTQSTPCHRRTIDWVLSTNQEVVRLISGILECTCSSNPQIHPILALIFHKLIVWYRAMIRIDHPGSDSSASSQSSAAESLNKKAQRHEAVQVSFLPITIGAYTFDAAIESKIRGQIILSELQRLELLVDNLSSSMQEANYRDRTSLGTSCGSSSSSSTVNSGPPTPSVNTKLASTVQRRLHDFLRGQLEAAKVETTSTLTN